MTQISNTILWISSKLSRFSWTNKPTPFLALHLRRGCLGTQGPWRVRPGAAIHQVDGGRHAPLFRPKSIGNWRRDRESNGTVNSTQLVLGHRHQSPLSDLSRERRLEPPLHAGGLHRRGKRRIVSGRTEI